MLDGRCVSEGRQAGRQAFASAVLVHSWFEVHSASSSIPSMRSQAWTPSEGVWCTLALGGRTVLQAHPAHEGPSLQMKAEV